MKISDKRQTEPAFQFAKNNKLITFTSIYPCNRGHFLFYVKNGQCKTCIWMNYQNNRDERIKGMNRYNQLNEQVISPEKRKIRTQVSNIQMRIRYWTNKPDTHPLKEEKIIFYTNKKNQLLDVI